MKWATLFKGRPIKLICTHSPPKRKLSFISNDHATISLVNQILKKWCFLLHLSLIPSTLHLVNMMLMIPLYHESSSPLPLFYFFEAFSCSHKLCTHSKNTLIYIDVLYWFFLIKLYSNDLHFIETSKLRRKENLLFADLDIQNSKHCKELRKASKSKNWRCLQWLVLEVLFFKMCW